jgi:hypothetical protein
MKEEGPVLVAKTALPNAIASSAASPNVSSRDGMTKKRQERIRPDTRPRLSFPRKRTLEPSPSSRAKRRKWRRSSLRPAMTRRASPKLGPSSFQAHSKRSIPL